MKDNLHFLINKFLSIFPDKTIVYLDFFIAKKKFLNLKNPRSFSEKIQWIKVYGNLEKYTQYADKYDVRKFVEKTIGKKYLIPLLGVWNSFDEIPFEKLPNKFVLKATHGSGYNYICPDKTTLDKNKLRIFVNKWLKENFYSRLRESQYKNCVPKIICEKYMEDESGSLRDYKFFCFNGNPCIAQVDSDRYSNHTRDLFDLKWKKLLVTYGHANSRTIISKPSKFSEMLEIARKLSKNFPLVRIDLYLIKNRIYFGELTFTPCNGLDLFKPVSFDYELGKHLNLPVGSLPVAL